MRIAMIGQKGFDVGKRGGGVERHVTEISKRLVDHGHDVTVYARARYGHTEETSVRVRYVPTVYRKNIETILHTFLCTLDSLFRPYDIVHYHGVGPATLAWIPRLFKRSARVVVTFHSQDRYHKKWGKAARLYLFFGEWAACWFPHASIAVSHHIQVFARKYLRKQIVHIPNGAEPRVISETNALKQFDLESQKYLLSVSRLEPHKGQWYLIEAFKRLEQEHPDIVQGMKVVIVGAQTYGSSYEQELKRAARGSRNISFLGFQSGATLEQLFAHAKIFVHASEAEGLPVVVLEAMSYGTPVLVSDIPENVEAIHDCGYTFRSTDVNDLKNHLADMLSPDNLLHVAGACGQQVIEEQYSWELVTKRTEALYRTLRH